MADLVNEDCHPIVVAPTGSGKSLMICDFIDKYLTHDPHARILILSHIKEILEQDHDALTDYFEGTEIGLYSTGMGSKVIKKITVAGIQTAYRKPELFKDAAIVIIDECHLVTIRQNGMYRKLLSKIDAQYVGFTATHFRLGHGYIHEGEGALFNKIAFDISSPENFNKLVHEGYLTKLITKATLMRMDTHNLHIRAGDYAINELSNRFDREAVTNKAVDEVIEYGANYHKWLIFAIDIDHAEHITATLNSKGVSAVAIHSKMTTDRDHAVIRFRKGKYRAAVNVDILTTGFDVPSIDLIAMLRPTQSPVIHVQTIGRGLRVADGKDHCLVLDFAGNTSRLGPINDVQIKQKKKGPGHGTAPVKECPSCLVLHHPKTKICNVCGHEFVFKTKLTTTADTIAVVSTTYPAWYNIDDIKYKLHVKEGRPTSMKVSYRVGLHTFNDWICYNHRGYAKFKANNWVKFRAPEGMPMPKDVLELYEWSDWLKKPVEIHVDLSQRFPQILDSKF